MATDFTQPLNALAVCYHATGDPQAVLKMETIVVPPPGPDEVLLKLVAATVNPSDLGMIRGTYGRLRELPAVAGREGVAEVVALGNGVDAVSIGDWVQMPESIGVWRQYGVANVEQLIKAPKILTPEQAATAWVNPATAVRLLSDFGELRPGDWVIQNAANSAVGFGVVGYARHLRIHTINLVRNLELKEELLAAGADVVVSAKSDYPRQIQSLTGGPLPKLGLNSVGGESVSQMIKCMAEGATVVTFGGMVGDKIRFPTRELIFKDVHLRGYWMDRWNRSQSSAALNAFYQHVFECLQQGILRVPIDSVFPFEAALTAIHHGLASGRRGKVIILNSSSSK